MFLTYIFSYLYYVLCYPRKKNQSSIRYLSKPITFDNSWYTLYWSISLENHLHLFPLVHLMPSEFEIFWSLMSTLWVHNIDLTNLFVKTFKSLLSWARRLHSRRYVFPHSTRHNNILWSNIFCSISGNIRLEWKKKWYFQRYFQIICTTTRRHKSLCFS